MPKGFFHEEILNRDYPQIKLHLVGDMLEAMRAVSFGEADAAVGELAVFNHFIKRDLMTDLTISGELKMGSEGLDKLWIATRKDMPVLASILKKGMDAITKKQKQDLRVRYLSTEGSQTTGQIGEAPADIVTLVMQIGGGLLILILLLFAMSQLLKLLGTKDTTKLYESKELKGLGMVLIALFLCVVVLSAWFAVQGSGQKMRQEVGESLRTVLQTTREAMRIWVDGKKNDLTMISGNPELGSLTKKLLSVPRNPDDLLGSWQLVAVRDELSKEKEKLGDTGFFIIAPDGTSIASMRDENVGTANLIHKQRKALLDRVFRGETVLVPPIVSDVSLKTEGGKVVAKAPTMFFAAPIRDIAGKAVAVLTMRLDPSKDFTRITQLGRIGQSGETYVFDNQARLITESRFDDHLRQIGLIGEEENAILNILIRDPGGNLLAGHPMPSDLGSQPLTLMAAEATAKKNGGNIEGYRDYRGVEVVGEWLWDESLGIGMTTEIDVDEAMATFRDTRNTILIVLGVTVLMALVLAGLSAWIGQSANRSLRKARDELEDKVEERTQDLQDNEERTRAILNSAADGVIVIDERGIIESISPSAENIFGYSAEEVVGRNVKMLMPDPFESEHDGYLARYRESGEATILGTNREVVGLRKDGTEFPMDLAVGEARVEGGRIFASVVRDISERKAAEAELAQKEAHLRLALDNMSDGLFVIDPDMHFTLFNERYEEHMAVGRDVLYDGCSVSNLVIHLAESGAWGEGDPNELAQARVAALANDQVIVSETETTDGRTLETRKTPLEGGGCVGVMSDITQRKKFEEEIKEARDAAEEATKAKASFLAAMSHEIRTPMNGVVGMIDLLQQTKLDGDQRQMTRTVRDSAYALLTIINDILDFSKIEAGKLDLEEIPVSISELVDGVAEILAPNVRTKGINLRTFVDPDIPDAVLGDEVRTRQILFNLGGNAVKFTEEGKVLIRADVVPSRAKNKVKVRFQIIDDGIGIPEEAQANLFQAFSQVDASTTRRFGGTGLGLTICQRLVEMMKGSIGVESTPGEGSTFSATITFPVAQEHTIKSDGHDLEDLNVLMVLADDDMRELFPRYLEHWKASVTAIADVNEAKPMALKAANDGTPFDVIVIGTGWTMDEQASAISSLRSDKGLSSTRFVLLSRSRKKEDQAEIESTVYVNAGPLRRANLIRGVAVAAGRASPDVEYDEDRIALKADKAPTVEDAEAMGQLVLMAEDNATNQDVIRRQLNGLGYAVEIANDGKEALDLLDTRSFAVLLTDCHMPNMDGFELTETIRKSELDGDARLPIVAITASVLKEEIDRCFAAGMDDFLPKPLEMQKLKEMMAKLMPVSDAPAEGEPAPEEAETVEPAETEVGGDGPVDPAALQSMFGDDPDTIREIMQGFIEPSQKIVEDIETAFANRSATDIGAGAHKLKSAARSIGANALAALCQDLETAGKTEDWEEIDTAAPRLAGVMQEVTDYIEAL